MKLDLKDQLFFYIRCSKIRNVFKAEEVGTSLIKKVLETIKIYTILILPLIIMAAFSETYIADIIFSLFE
ncbi:hypothetical protein AZE41_04595 [Sporosarcina psychrophila]|nr:hypothetical protein AZE41_04595 [Sporosarcina psychrophila]